MAKVRITIMIELYLSTDGKHTVHVQGQSIEEMDKVLPYVRALYSKVTKELGTKPEMWRRAMGGHDNSSNSSLPQDDKHKTDNGYGIRIDTPQQAEQLFAPVCPIHQTPMKSRSGQFGQFWSCGTRLPNGRWCNQKPSSASNHNNNHDSTETY